ncbi:MAG: hypothetical protein R3B55_00855 [Candidatus Paceibacterota bacterium]
MQNYLPSKQFVKTILVTLLAAAVLVVVGKLLSNKSVWENKDSKSIVSSSENEDFFSKDTDGDGLYDWEEALWNTNPRVKDSDGDGIDDKTFVENKRKTIDADETYKENPDNETEVFAKQFFTTAAVLNQGGTFNQDTVDQFSSGINKSIVNFSLKDKYTLSSLKLSNISPDQYRQNISDLFNRLQKPEINELTILAYIMENPNDLDGLDELGNYLAFSDALIKGLLTMNVPNSNAGLHLSYVNNLDKISEIMRSALYIEEDPLRVVTYLSKYDEYSDRLLKDIESFKKYFNSNGII